MKKMPLKLKGSNKLKEDVFNVIQDADKVVIGAGSGLNASAGLNYNDEELFAKAYTPFLKAGYNTIYEGIRQNWFLTWDNAKSYWGFWSHHINYIYYSQKQLNSYHLLYDIIKDKNYFVVTTNGDGQFFKGNFDTSKIFAMQGNYGKFQCQHGCKDIVYDNKSMIKKMIKGFNKETLEILEEDIPRCSECGRLLSPHLRIDQHFVKGSSMLNKNGYVEFVSGSKEKIVFLELGVGFNTPGIIRYPFENMTYNNDLAVLIRVNDTLFETPDEIKDRTIIVKTDIHEFFEAVAALG